MEQQLMETTSCEANGALEVLLCKISSIACESEKINDSFNELKKRYGKVLRDLLVANETNELLRMEIRNLKCREAALLGYIRQNTEIFGEEEYDPRLIY